MQIEEKEKGTIIVISFYLIGMLLAGTIGYALLADKVGAPSPFEAAGFTAEDLGLGDLGYQIGAVMLLYVFGTVMAKSAKNFLSDDSPYNDVFALLPMLFVAIGFFVVANSMGYVDLQKSTGKTLGYGVGILFGIWLLMHMSSRKTNKVPKRKK